MKAIKKEQPKCQLLRIGLLLNANGMKFQEVLYEGFEKNSTYEVSAVEKDSVLSDWKRRIRKTDLMKIDSNIHDSVISVHRMMWCLPSEKEKVKETLKNAVVSVANKMKEDFDAMYNHIND
jgi:hypothetical protein